MISRRGRHLREERFIECYLAVQSGDPVDPPIAEHFADCAECSARYRELARMMDSLRVDADQVTDAVFPVDALKSQREQISRRLEQLGHAARVITFPGRSASSRDAQPRRLTPRWTVAAAAGLLIGVALGSSYDWRHGSTVAQVSAPAIVIPPAVMPAPAQPAPIDDNVLLSQIEVAIDGPRTRALQPFQTLTPSYREPGAER